MTGIAGSITVGNSYCGAMGPAPAPVECNNGGMKYAVYYDNDYAAWNNANNFDPTVFKSERPEAGPSVTYTVGDKGSSSLYDSGLQWTTTEHFVLNQVGYLIAPETGTYTFSFPYANDVLVVWVGPNAYSGWTRSNANAVISYYGGSFTFQMTKGQYYPFRIILENTWGGAALTANVWSPSGKDLLATANDQQPNLVQYSCDGTTAPVFADFSSTATSPSPAESSLSI